MNTPLHLSLVTAGALLLAAQAAAAGATSSTSSNQWVLDYSTYLGGDGSPQSEYGYAVIADSKNNMIVAGRSESPGFPITLRFGPSDNAKGAFVTKIDSAGRQILFSVFFAGGAVHALAVDGQDNLYLAGDSPGYYAPTNGFQNTYGGGNSDAFVAKLSPDGSNLLFFTFLGGNGMDMARGIAVDSQGQVWVTGWTGSTNFPVTTNALQLAPGGKYDAFVAHLSASGQALLYSTYLGGDQTDVASCLALDKGGNVYVGGWTSSAKFANNLTPRPLGGTGSQNGFIAKLSADGESLSYLTLLGAPDGDAMVAALAVDTLGQAYVFGETDATNFPVSLGAWQAQNRGGFDNFLLKLNPQGSALLYGTYLGSPDDDYTERSDYDDDGTEVRFGKGGLAVDSSGQAYVAARAGAGGFAPLGIAVNTYSGYYDGYVAKFSPDGSQMEHFLYLGNANWDGAFGLALDGAGRVLITGSVSPGAIPPYLPITAGALVVQQGGNHDDVFVTRLAESQQANDAFTNRIALAGPQTSGFGNSSGATKEPGEPNHAGNAGGKSLWWSWRAPATGRLIVSTAGSSFDTLLAVYTNSSLTALQAVASNDDRATDDKTSEVEFPVQNGIQYQIAVDGHDGDSGSVLLTLTLSVPPNDDFADRITLTNYPVTVSGSNVDASWEPGDPAKDRNVWWQWIAPVSGPVTLSTHDSTFDSYVAVFTNSALADLGLLAVSDQTKQVTLQAVAGTPYQISVGGGYFLSSGNITLKISPGAPPPNDNFTNSIPLTGTSTNFTANNYAASREPAEPVLSGPDFRYGPGYHTVWWSWQAPGDGRVTLATAGSSFDTRMGVFTGSALTNLQLVAWNDDPMVPHPADPHASQVNFAVRSNALYYVMLDGSEYDPEGQIQFSLHFYHSFSIVNNFLALPTTAGFHLQGTGYPGAIYGVEVSTNLLDWAAVPTPDLVGPAFEWKDTNASNYPRRFYRWIEKKP